MKDLLLLPFGLPLPLGVPSPALGDFWGALALAVGVFVGFLWLSSQLSFEVVTKELVVLLFLPFALPLLRGVLSPPPVSCAGEYSGPLRFSSLLSRGVSCLGRTISSSSLLENSLFFCPNLWGFVFFLFALDNTLVALMVTLLVAN